MRADASLTTVRHLVTRHEVISVFHIGMTPLI